MKNRRELISNPKRLAVAQITLGEKINGKKPYYSPGAFAEPNIMKQPPSELKLFCTFR